MSVIPSISINLTDRHDGVTVVPEAHRSSLDNTGIGAVRFGQSHEPFISVQSTNPALLRQAAEAFAAAADQLEALEDGATWNQAVPV
jgi:hypothetical protein